MPTTKGILTSCLAPRRSSSSNPSGEETALFAFIVPTLNIPIDIPVTVRTESDYGLTLHRLRTSPS